jgi:DNA-binding Lrp family transcriptional regulator
MTLAFVFVNCVPEQSAFVESAAKKVKGVLEAYTITGIYDVVVKAQADDEIKLQQVIKTIKSIFGVTSTITNIVYKADNPATEPSTPPAYTT